MVTCYCAGDMLCVVKIRKVHATVEVMSPRQGHPHSMLSQPAVESSWIPAKGKSVSTLLNSPNECVPRN